MGMCTRFEAMMRFSAVVDLIQFWGLDKYQQSEVF